MTKIPVIEESEMFFKVKDIDQLIEDTELEVKLLEKKYRKREHLLAMIALGVAATYLAISALNGLTTTAKLLDLFTSNPEQAQCESIGGRYDGEACWYNGSKIDVNKYVEEWK